MDREPWRAFSKQGPRAKRVALRDAHAAIEQECETYVREKMKPGLVASAKAAITGFKRQTGR